MAVESSVNLESMGYLSTVFELLSTGRHINRVISPVLWADIENNREDYQRTFTAMGYPLSIDNRGFAWCETGDESLTNARTTPNKTTVRLGIVLMAVFNYQADRGKNLARFEDWRIDAQLLEAVEDHCSPLFTTHELDDGRAEAVLRQTAVKYGFAYESNGGFYLLSAVFRYLEHIEAVSEVIRSSEAIPQSPTENGE